nr:carboxyl transferase domain-containing protein [Jatrophihabitans endophyticus]
MSAVCAERFDALFDTWRAIDRGEGVDVARGAVAGVDTVAFATDPGTQGGALGADGCRAIVAATELAVAQGIPVVGIWRSGGARLGEGVDSLDGMARVFAVKSTASGRVLQLSLVVGPSAGGAAYGPALTDVVVMGPEGRIFVTGPDVVRNATGEDVDMERLGGPDTQGRSGVAHVVCETDDEAVRRSRAIIELTSRLGSAHDDDEERDDPGELLPGSGRRAYDVVPIVRALLDGGEYLEFQAGWARNVTTGLGRLGGRTVGVVATNPLHLAGCLDASSGDKSGRFVQWCDALGIALVFLVDVPGYLPGLGQEEAGVVRRGAKLLHAYATASVPRLTVVLRKAFGGAYIAMGSRGLGADHVLAWPEARIGVMGAEAAVEILHRRELVAIADEQDRANRLAELADDYLTGVGGLERALETGVVDAVVAPAATRRHLIAALRDSGAPHGSDRPNPPL